MSDQGWLADARTSHDAVAVSYADELRDALPEEPYLPGIPALIADMVGRPATGRRRPSTADVGYGPRHVVASLSQLGVDAFGIDLSPAMVDVARRDYPGLRFAVAR